MEQPAFHQMKQRHLAVPDYKSRDGLNNGAVHIHSAENNVYELIMEII